MEENETKARVVLAAVIVALFVGFVFGYWVRDNADSANLGFHSTR